MIGVSKQTAEVPLFKIITAKLLIRIEKKEILQRQWQRQQPVTSVDEASGGRGKYGLRLDYPAHLGSEYRSLDAYGAKLRNQSQKGFRRNIRFNDDEMSLVMDVKFPSQEKWIRINAKIAKEQKGISAVSEEEEVKKMITAGLQSGPPALTGANAEPVSMEGIVNESWRTPRTNNLGEPLTR